MLDVGRTLIADHDGDAILESFARQLVGQTWERLSIGGSMLALWLAYFFAFRRLPQGAVS